MAKAREKTEVFRSEAKRGKSPLVEKNMGQNREFGQAAKNIEKCLEVGQVIRNEEKIASKEKTGVKNNYNIQKSYLVVG